MLFIEQYYVNVKVENYIFEFGAWIKIYIYLYILRFKEQNVYQYLHIIQAIR